MENSSAFYRLKNESIIAFWVEHFGLTDVWKALPRKVFHHWNDCVTVGPGVSRESMLFSMRSFETLHKLMGEQPTV
jgi:hypothetical protein